MNSSTKLVLALTGITLLSGCVQPDGGSQVEIRTSYYLEDAYPGNRAHGLSPGAPATRAFVSLDVDVDGTSQQCDFTQDLLDGMGLRQADCYYEGELSDAGTIAFSLPENVMAAMRIVIAGQTPEQPEGCNRQYQSSHPNTGDDHEYTVRNGESVTVPFYIVCREYID